MVIRINIKNDIPAKTLNPTAKFIKNIFPDENNSPAFPFSSILPKKTPDPINPIKANIINPKAPMSSATLNVLAVIPLFTLLTP